MLLPLRHQLKRKPFVPFRLKTADGEFEVLDANEVTFPSGNDKHPTVNVSRGPTEAIPVASIEKIVSQKPEHNYSGMKPQDAVLHALTRLSEPATNQDLSAFFDTNGWFLCNYDRRGRILSATLSKLEKGGRIRLAAYGLYIVK
jgi:hypothetical protein